MKTIETSKGKVFKLNQRVRFTFNLSSSDYEPRYLLTGKLTFNSNNKENWTELEVTDQFNSIGYICEDFIIQ